MKQTRLAFTGTAAVVLLAWLLAVPASAQKVAGGGGGDGGSKGSSAPAPAPSAPSGGSGGGVSSGSSGGNTSSGGGYSGGGYSRGRGYYGGYGYYDPWGYAGGYGYYGGYYDPWYGGYPTYPVGSSSSNDDEGSLRLKIKPREAEVYVDGYFVGVVDDFDGIFQRLHLDSGPHRIEVRAAGFESLTFEVRITPEHTTTYQGELKKIQ